MNFPTKIGTAQSQKTACLVLGVPQGRKLSGLVALIDKTTKRTITQLMKSGEFSGKREQTAVIHHPQGMRCERLLLIGCGKPGQLDIGKYRTVCASAAEELKSIACNEATVLLTHLEVQDCNLQLKARHLVESMETAAYTFNQLKTEPKNRGTKLKRVVILVDDRSAVTASRAGVKHGRAISAGQALARDLGNLPGNICTPGYLADRARELAKEYPVKTKVLEQRDMEKLGMGALLSVARGSRQPPKLIIMEYFGGAKNDAPIVLVGKGLTFDAGGISIKPAQNMDEMKFDMCGAASVFGALLAIAMLGLDINVVGLVPSSENLPDGNANKPGDIVTSMSGQTIEVLNTDAEGRLILCDALTYSERYKPHTVIDIATLTGACVVALGSHASGLMTDNEALAQELLTAGYQSMDRAWQLPLWEDYQSQLDSNFADMANIGGRDAGAITAGCFLERFTRKLNWAHIDIAGTAWKTGKAKGATGRVVPLLTQFVINRCASERGG